MSSDPLNKWWVGDVGDRAAKDALYDGFAGVAKALGNGRRTEIVDLLAQGERSVDEVANELGQSVANTSQHLQQLLRAGLVRTRRDGTRDELTRRLRGGDLVVLDVGPEPEFVAGHIAAAVSLPIHELTRRLRDVPKDRQVVAYCRGPYCVYADDAVRALRRRGYRAARLEDGYPEWARAGLPVQTHHG